MVKSIISVERMVRIYVDYELNEDTWKMFYNMRLHNLISEKTWSEFCETCKDWNISENGQQYIADGNGCIIFIRDDNGFFVEA